MKNITPYGFGVDRTRRGFSMLQPALAQDKYPSRPIEFIVPWGPGGGADQLARKIAPALEKELKVSLPVINVAGATGQTGLNKMLTSAADGYSVSIFIADTLAVLMDPATKWKIGDIVPAAVMIRQPSAFFVAETSPLKTWADVEREARKRPLKVAITGFGSADDLHVIFFKGKNYQFTAVPFPKPAERYSSVLGGHADLLYEQLGDVRPRRQADAADPDLPRRASRRSAPSRPAMSSATVAISQFRSIAMKSGTDAQRVKAVSDALAKVAATDDYKAWLKDQYADEKSFIGADGAVAFMKRELETMTKYAPRK